MIVNHHEKGWKIISHYTHGLLTGKFARQLQLNLRPEPWLDILTGIIEHDDYLVDFEKGDYLTENGSPKDFTMSEGSDSDSLDHAQRVYSNANQKSQLTGLLVGRHLDFLYRDLGKEFPPMDEFLKTVRTNAKTQRKLYGFSKKGENDAYDLMRFCDRCSLIICQNEVPITGRKLEINKTIGNKRYYIYRNDNHKYTIEPWPFESHSFDVEYEFRMLTQPIFKTPKELKRAIERATVELASVGFKKA